MRVDSDAVDFGVKWIEAAPPTSEVKIGMGREAAVAIRTGHQRRTVDPHTRPMLSSTAEIISTIFAIAHSATGLSALLFEYDLLQSVLLETAPFRLIKDPKIRGCEYPHACVTDSHSLTRPRLTGEGPNATGEASPSM